MKKMLTFVRSLGILAVVLVALFAVGTALALTELVTNGDFSSDFTTGPWVQVDSLGSATYTTPSNPSPGSGGGSARLEGDASSTIGEIDQCVPFIANGDLNHDNVSVGGWVLLDNVLDTSAHISVHSYTGANCTGTESPSPIGDTPTLDPLGTTWQVITTSTSAFGVPADTVSLRIRLIVLGDPGVGAYFDDVTAYPSTPTAVTLRDFAAQSQPPAAWLWPVAVLILLSGAWVVSRRRRA